MTLTLGATSHAAPANSINNSFSCLESAKSSNWRVENLTLGAKHELGVGSNSSDVGYNPFTKRFGFVRNNFGTVTEISEADIVNGVESPQQIRVITINGLFGLDTEALTDVFPNLLEGGYEFWTGIENGGRNYAYNVSISETDMLSTSDISVTARQEKIMAANATTSNRGMEGFDVELITQQMVGVQEGDASGADKIIYSAQRPTDRDTNYSYDDGTGQLVVTNPFDAQAIITGDLSSICWHPATGHYIILSETGNAVYQYDTSGNLISTLSGLGAELFQPEGICLHGDNLVIMGEVSEYCYCTYSAP